MHQFLSVPALLLGRCLLSAFREAELPAWDTENEKAGLRKSIRIPFWGNPRICQWAIWDATSSL